MKSSIATCLVLVLQLALSSVLLAEEPENTDPLSNLVLLPVESEQISRDLREGYRSVIAEYLGAEYKVFTGSNVDDMLQTEFEKQCKISDDVDAANSECVQNVAGELNADLVALPKIIQTAEGYLVTLEISDVFTEQLITTYSEICAGCSPLDLTSTFQKMIFNKGSSTTSTPLFINTTGPTSGGSSSVVDLGTPVKPQDRGKLAVLLLESIPSGAEVWLGDIKAGTTPYQNLQLSSGQNLNITLKAQDYRDLQVALTLQPGSNTPKPFELTPAFGALSITSEPSGADVYLSGELVGQTPYSNKRLASAKYLVDIRKPLYLPLSNQTIAIEDGQRTERSFKLEPNFGDLSVASEPPAATITLEASGREVYRGSTPISLQLEPATYILSASKSGYAQRRFEVTIARGDRTSISKEQLQLRQLLGTAIISSEPASPGARVLIDGKDAGAIPLITELPVGTYEVTIKADQLSGTANLQIRDDQQQMLVVDLKAENVVVNVIENLVVFDGSPLQYSSWSKLLPSSNFLFKSKDLVSQTGSPQYLSNIKKRYESMVIAYLSLADKQTSIPLITHPDIPPALELTQGEFEADSAFQIRFNDAVDKRNQEVVALQADYQSRVELRNEKIDLLEVEQSKRRRALGDQKIHFLSDALRSEFIGFKIELSHFDQYDAKMYYRLVSNSSDYERLISIDANTGGRGSTDKNRRLAENADKIVPSVTFRIDDDKFQLHRVRLHDSPSSNILANNASASIIEATLASTTENVPNLLSEQVLIDSDIFARKIVLQKQNPNLIDEFRFTRVTFNNGITEFRGTGLQGDEIWQKVQKLRNRRLDKNAYIFAVSIENYINETDVPYATNSAELIAELFRLKAGVPEANIFLLTGRSTTGTFIEGTFRKLLNALEINEDSKLYFYYAGHGLPTSKAVYMLPSDAITGAYIDDGFNLGGFLERIAKTNIKHAYIFLDTCFSGKTDLDTLAYKGVSEVGLSPQKPKLADNFTVFYGCKVSQFANAYNNKRHRMMTYYLTEGVLNGRDSIHELADYVSENVRRTSARLGPDHMQEPYVEGNKKVKLF